MTDRQQLFSQLHQAVLTGEDGSSARLARQCLESGFSALETVEEALVPGIREAGQLWEEGEYFLPELVTAAQAMKAAMAVLEPALGAQARLLSRGRVVIGTVEGDIHDIGKSLVATMLSANGFEVIDEGAGVPAARFVERAREIDADLVCASALLTTTMPRQRELVGAVRAAGLRARVLLGGAPVTRSWAEAVGADGYADNAHCAVDVARSLVEKHAPR